MALSDFKIINRVEVILQIWNIEINPNLHYVSYYLQNLKKVVYFRFWDNRPLSIKLPI